MRQVLHYKTRFKLLNFVRFLKRNKSFKTKEDFYLGNKIIKTKKDFYLETKFLNLKSRFLFGNKIFKFETEIFKLFTLTCF